jgi:TonB family protein
MRSLTKIDKLLILPWLLILSLGFSSCVYFNTYYNAKRYFREGVKENENNTDPTKPKTTNYQKAIDAAARVLESYPKSKYVDDALMIMGKSYYEIRNFPKAKRKFEELLTNYPNSELVNDARLWLGRTQVAMGQTDEGIATLTNLWSDNVPESIRLMSQRSLADYYYDKKNYRQALLEYQKILERSHDSREKADVWYQTGECYYSLGEPQEAEKAYRKVSDQEATRKRRFEGEYKRAITLRKLNDPQAALKICESLIKNRDFFAYIDQAYLTKAEILSDLNRAEEAEALFKRIIELYPRTDASAKAAYLLGMIYMEKMQDFDKAEEYLVKVPMEKAGGEFAQIAQDKVQDLRFLKGLNREIDSLNMDLDTLRYQLTWIAEHPQGTTDSLQASTAASDSLQLKTAVQTDSSRDPEFYARQRLQGRPDQMPERPGSLGYSPGMEGREDPGMRGMPGMAGQQGIVPNAPIRLAALPPDSASVEKREAADREALAEARYRLAEHLWYQFANYDSARVIFTELTAQEQYRDLAASSMMSLYNMTRQVAADTTLTDSLRFVVFDTTKIDTLPRCIHERFADTPYDRWARQRLGLEPLPEPVDSAELLFLQAEDLFLQEQKLSNAVKEYLHVTEKYPDSDLAPKALYAAAWLDEFQLNKSESAKVLYDTLAAKYPDSEYAAVAKRKLTPLPPEEDTTEVLEDTTGLAGELALGSAPSGSGAPQMMGGAQALENSIHKNHLYPTVAAEAEISGEVTVSFRINAQGIAGSFEILREEPQGFDFGEAAIQALQAMRYKPAYEDGKYIEGTLTQTVRFTP